MQSDRLRDAMRRIQPLDRDAMAAARDRHATLTKPPGSLGRLERLAVQMAGITGSPTPHLDRRAVIVMAADHGVAAEHVSAYPAAVTAQMVHNFARGGAAMVLNGQDNDAPAELEAELNRLKQEHRDLDTAIEALARMVAGDQLQVQRLKKRKLILKDRIKFLEDELTPDIIA